MKWRSNFKLSVAAILVSIIFFGAFLRLVDISNNPRGLYGDELTLVYDSYSILKTGHDQKGAFLPLVFKQGGDRPGGYVYATVPFVALLGPTALAVRIVSVLSGIGLILLIFLFVRSFFSDKAALLAAFFMAISPWDISISRGGFETHFALLLSVFGVLTFYKALKKPWWFLISGLCFALSMQTYPTYRITVPLFIIFLFLLNKFFTKKVRIKDPWLLSFLAMTLLSFVLAVFLTLSREDDRFSTINVLAQSDLRQTLIQKIDLERNIDAAPSSVAKIFHNIVWEYAGIFAENYLNNYKPDFLFLHGDGTPRHNMATMGEFYWIDFILAIFGIFALFKTKRELLYLLIGWIIIAPIGTSIVGGPHALRDSFLLPPIIILSAIGLVSLWQISKRISHMRALLILLSLLLVFQFSFFVERQYFSAPDLYSRFWAYPSKQAAQIAIKNRGNYDFILISTELSNAEFAYPVYSVLDPNRVIEQNIHPTNFGGYTFRRYDNVYIGQVPDPLLDKFIEDLPGTVLYIGPAQQTVVFKEPHSIITGTERLANLVVVSKGRTYTP